MAQPPEPVVRPPAVERRVVSVLFADLVGFTPLSESLDSEDVATIQDAYFAATRETIERYGGVLEKFIGDAAMAVFGAPRARDDDAERAVRAGLALIGALERLEARLGLALHTLQLRVGVNTGEVVHATEGPDAGRVTGDTVNTAARFQAAAQPGSVLIGELTALTVAETIETRPIGSVDLKGKADPVPAWEAVAPRPQPSREEALGGLRAPMIGREAELQALHARLAEVIRDRSAARVLVVAPPGVGKSRLLAELAASSGATVLRARVRPQATAPYETVAQLLEAVATPDLAERLIAAGLPPARAAVVADEVGRLLAPGVGAAGGSGDLAADREARFEAWVTALDALAAAPSAWLVEDVHWAGGDLLAFLDHAGGAVTRHGRLVVTTARPSLLETAPAWCETDRIDLAPLPPDDAGTLVYALLGTALPERLVEAVVERSDGTPLFIEELVRTWASVGTLVRETGGWRLAVEPDEVALPATVHAIYAAQLDDLPPAARMVARRGAVAGRRVPVGALDALELPDGADGLASLDRRGFVTGPLADPLTGDAYAYRHALLRDAGYASLARAERARLHVAMAGWLEAVAGDRADVVAEGVAEHYATALASLPALASPDLPERALLGRAAAEWYERAARAAVGLSAHEAAARLLRRSVEHTAPDESLDRARRRLELGRILAASADLATGTAEIHGALAAYEEALPDAVGPYTDAVYALGLAYMQQIRFADAEALTAAALDTVSNAGATAAAGRSRLMALHAWSVSAQGRDDGSLTEAAEAERIAVELGDPVLELDVMEHRNAVRDELGDGDAEMWATFAHRSLTLGRWRQAVVASRVHGMNAADRDPAGALPALDAAAALAEAHGLTEQAGWVDLARAETLFVLGSWDEAIATGLRAVETGERYAYVRLVFRTWMVLLPMLAARGDARPLARYEAWWHVARDGLSAAPSPYASMLTAATPVWLAAARREPLPMPAEAVVESVKSFSNPHVQAAIEAIAEAWLGAGRRDLVARIVERPLDDDATPLMAASRGLINAWLAAADGDGPRAVGLARDAAAAAEAIGARWWLVRALRVTGDPSVSQLEASLATA